MSTIERTMATTSFTERNGELIHLTVATTTWSNGDTDVFERATSLHGGRVETHTRNGRLHDLPSGTAAFRILGADGTLVSETHFAPRPGGAIRSIFRRLQRA